MTVGAAGDTTNVNIDLIVMLAARNRLPAVYTFKFHGPRGRSHILWIVAADHYRQAALYVDRSFAVPSRTTSRSKLLEA